jgi:hypothetical protein
MPMFRRSRKHGDGQGDQETASERVNEVGLTDEQGDDAGDWRCRCSDATEA